jgi:colanic acid biosynthesis glycosyl transferase WcaI
VHILVISQYFWPENFRINDLVREWLQRGHQVTVLTGIPNYPLGQVFTDYRKQPEFYAQFNGARIVRVPMLVRGAGSFRLILNYLSFALSGMIFGPWLLRKVKSDVIFVFEPSPVTVGLPAVLIGKIKKIPVVFWALDLWPETLSAMDVVRSPKLLLWVGRLVHFIYDRCTLVLGQSRSFLHNIRKYCSDESKVYYFPSWAEEVFNESGNIAPAIEVPELKNGFTILFAGNIGEAQDMPSVLDAAELLKENGSIRWVFVGDGRKFEWLVKEVRIRGLENRVILPGRFNVERMSSFYAHADALLVSLKRDPVFTLTIPGKIQTYLIAGKPILGMLDGEGAAVIQDAKAGLTCDAGDFLGLANKVLELAAMSKAERVLLGARGREYAQKEFGRVHLINRLEILLSEAIDRYTKENMNIKTGKYF